MKEHLKNIHPNILKAVGTLLGGLIFAGLASLFVEDNDMLPWEEVEENA